MSASARSFPCQTSSSPTDSPAVLDRAGIGGYEFIFELHDC
ncbi:hypothetical protein [Mycobacterium camsae]|nr:hypothetical protein [Mycobacterium gordonae]